MEQNNQEKANKYIKILKERIAPHKLEGVEFGLVAPYFYYPERMEISSFLEAKEWAQNIKNELGFFDGTIQAIILNTLADSLNESEYNTAHKLLSRAIMLITEPIQKQKANKPAPQAFGSELVEEQPQRSTFQEPKTRVWALYYWYKREVGLHPELYSYSGSKNKKIAELAKKHGLGFQSFNQTFNAIGKDRDKNPKRNLINIKQVIPLLADFPEAQKKAETELKELEKKK